MSILAIIPARIGSKGIPEKNLKKISGYTLVERALFTAINTSSIDDVIVSTDSKRIQALVNKQGKYSPFIRPKKLATDRATSLVVIQHGLDWAEKNYKKKYDYIVLLEPPSPFRLPKHLDQAIDLAIDKNATSVVSLILVGDYHPIRMKKMNNDGKIEGLMGVEPDGVRRQDQEAVYIRNCAVYVFQVKTIKNNQLWGHRPYGFEMDKSLYGINIDEPLDYVLAKAFYDKMKIENKLNLIESFKINKERI